MDCFACVHASALMHEHSGHNIMNVFECALARWVGVVGSVRLYVYMSVYVCAYELLRVNASLRDCASRA